MAWALWGLRDKQKHIAQYCAYHPYSVTLTRTYGTADLAPAVPMVHPAVRSAHDWLTQTFNNPTQNSVEAPHSIFGDFDGWCRGHLTSCTHSYAPSIIILLN